MFEKEKQDIMSAEQILEELRRLAESERSENEEGSEQDAGLLEEAIASLEKFVDAEKSEENPESTDIVEEKHPLIISQKPAVDTGLLTGPMNSLKSFLIKKSQQNV